MCASLVQLVSNKCVWFVWFLLLIIRATCIYSFVLYFVQFHYTDQPAYAAPQTLYSASPPLDAFQIPTHQLRKPVVINYKRY